MALDVDTAAVRQAADFVADAAHCLHPDLDADVPPCGSDGVSQTVMNNLNARRRWLVEHVRSGAVQANNAAAGITATATSFEAQDAAGAAGYGGGGSGVAAPPAPAAPGAPAPPPMPAFSAIPDISGTEGETLAGQLEAGPGAGPAVAAATQLTTLSTRAHAAAASLTMARGQLLASGQSQAHPGLLRRLDRAISWSTGVAGHADALATGYGMAGDLHTATSTEVGTSAGWRMLKDSYNEAVAENAMSGGLAQGKVDALQEALAVKETTKGTAMGGYQVGGSTVSTPPGDLPDPGLDPHSSAASDKPSAGSAKDAGASGSEDGAGMQDMLGSLLGALGPLTQSLSKANPLSSLGQAAQMVSKLGGDAAKKAASPIRPAALAKPASLAGKGGGKGGGGSPIKPSSPLSGVRAASLSGAPPATPATGGSGGPSGPGGGRATGAGSGGGMGMMPMGHKPGGDEKTTRIHSYADPLSDVEDIGRPGVDGETAATAAPVVDPKAANAVRERLARRKRDDAVDGAT